MKYYTLVLNQVYKNNLLTDYTNDAKHYFIGTGSVSPNEEALDNYVASTQGYPSPPSQKERSHTSGAYFRYSDDTTRESSGSEDISREIV